VPVLAVRAVLIIGRWLDYYLSGAPAPLANRAVTFSGWLGGVRPSLSTSVRSILGFKHYFVPPVHSLAVGAAEMPRLAPCLFEAFSTTRPGGLGMGRSNSRSIMGSHRGRRRATANPDHGATLRLALPGMQ
jgi:K+-sensing histidine kinase KdpD